MNNDWNIDITPNPRILRALGEIPFSPWQCIAELIDNSIDAFSRDNESATCNVKQQINISWSGDNVSSNERSVEISDNASGMSLEQMQNAVRAGYTSNDPVNNLGLFGMGFNIATARLGERTTILSTRSGDTEWLGITIDFETMIKTKKFDAMVEKQYKMSSQASGTKIIVSRLRNGIHEALTNKINDIRKQLATIYTPLLSAKDVIMLVKGQQLNPLNHCIWSQERYVIYNKQQIPAFMRIDKDLGNSLFDLNRNRYLSVDETEPHYVSIQKGETLPDNIVERSKRLTGWLGIQRYADPNDFGIDFIRNGRKILVYDKTLFQYENPYTGQKELQYPLELGTTVGGRIVGELHVDYLLPTYQKNDFDRTDDSWRQTVETICGLGPFRIQRRKELGFTENLTSPLGLLVNAYARANTGTKCLFAPNDLSKQYFKYFRNNKREYITDEPWWKAAQEEDQKRITGGARLATPVNTGELPSDNIGAYLNNFIETTQTITPCKPDVSEPVSQRPPIVETSTLNDLLKHSTQVAQLSGKYALGVSSPLIVRVYELQKGLILDQNERKPCFFRSEGIECDFIYDPEHTVLTQYPITAKGLLLLYLADKFRARDGLKNIVDVFALLVESHMTESKIDHITLQEKSASMFKLLRDKLSIALKPNAINILLCIHESSGEVEDTINAMLSDSELIKSFQKCDISGFDALEYVPNKTPLRLVDKFPELIFDGKVFSAPFNTINLSDVKATERSRNESKDRIMSFVKDALLINSIIGQKERKNELSRAALSLEFLLEELNA
jgi:hypothetical protein